MIKITDATHEGDFRVRLRFSDGSGGVADFSTTMDQPGPLTEALRSPDQFRRFFIEFGALAWPNGLEFSPASLHKKLAAAGSLSRDAA